MLEQGVGVTDQVASNVTIFDVSCPFLRSYAKKVPCLSVLGRRQIYQLKPCITAAVESVPPAMLRCIWAELSFQLYVCRATKRTQRHSKLLTPAYGVNLHFSALFSSVYICTLNGRRNGCLLTTGSNFLDTVYIKIMCVIGLLITKTWLWSALLCRADFKILWTVLYLQYLRFPQRWLWSVISSSI
jgi:hypothetical protein